jgi:chromosome segregation ATPase
MIAGIATAVAGAVACFFAHLLLAAAGFAALGAVSGLGLYLARRHALSESLVQTADRLKETEKKLSGEVDRLHHENNTLHTRIDQLTKIKDDLEANNRALARTKDDLAAQVGHLEGALQHIKDEVIALNKQNLAFRNSLEGLDKCSLAFDASLTRFNEDFASSYEELERQIAGSKKLFDETFYHLSQQKLSLSQELDKVKQIVADLLNDKSMQEKLNMLSSLEEKMQAVQEEGMRETLKLQEVRVQYTCTADELARLTKDLERVKNEFEETRQRIDKSVNTLTEVSDSLKSNPSLEDTTLTI